MGKDKKIMLIMNIIIAFAIFSCVFSIALTYRHNIYNFLSKKIPDADAHEVLNPNSASDAVSDIELVITETAEIPVVQPVAVPPPATERLTEKITEEVTEEITEKITEESTTLPPVTDAATPTELETAPPVTSPPATDAPPEPIKRVPEVPDLYFISSMFKNAVEIPESDKKIEFPPFGRSIELQYGAVPLSETIPDPFEYFRNAIFLGDSVTTGFDLYRNSIKFNGEAVLKDVTVVAVGSYGIYNASREISDNSIHPLFEGRQTLPEDIIAQKDAKNVFICLGLNDLTWMSTNNFLNHYAKLINKIKAKSPGKNIVIMSVTPVVEDQQVSSLSSVIIEKANNALLDFAIYNNLQFVDYAAAIRDSANNLYGEFSSDNHCHLTISAYNRLVEYMLYHPVKD